MVSRASTYVSRIFGMEAFKGLPLESVIVDAQVLDSVTQHSLARIEQPCGLRPVPAGRFERVLNQILLERIDRVAERDVGAGPGRFSRLQRRRQVMRVQDL